MRRTTLALAAMAAPAMGYIYHLTHSTGSDVASADESYTQSALVLSEVIRRDTHPAR